METKICAISDLHGYLPELPSCDVVVICGDIIPLNIQKNYEASLAWLSGPFQSWALNLDCKKVIFIAGNHDFVFEQLYNGYVQMMGNNNMPTTRLYFHSERICDTLFQMDNTYDPKLIYLCDGSYVYQGVKFYGTPWCPGLKNWAFYGDSGELIKKFENIPNDFDVLLTHCPPKFGQQGVVLETNWNFGSNFGCQELEDILKHKTQVRSDVCYILSGHIHSGNHQWEHKGPRHYRNVSIKDENYDPVYQPCIFTIYK